MPALESRDVLLFIHTLYAIIHFYWISGSDYRFVPEFSQSYFLSFLYFLGHKKILCFQTGQDFITNLLITNLSRPLRPVPGTQQRVFRFGNRDATIMLPECCFSPRDAPHLNSFFRSFCTGILAYQYKIDKKYPKINWEVNKFINKRELYGIVYITLLTLLCCC